MPAAALFAKEIAPWTTTPFAVMLPSILPPLDEVVLPSILTPLAEVTLP